MENLEPTEITTRPVGVAASASAPRQTRWQKRPWPWIALALGIVVCIIAAVVLLHKKSAPEPARLLPEADAILYLDLRPARIAYLSKHPIPPSSDYAAFEAATGIDFERDLNEMAFAVHVLGNPVGPQGPFGFSEVFTGHFDRARVESYLQAQSAATENFGGDTIYAIPHEGRTVRCVILGSGMIAASNMPTPEQIHHIVDASRSALPFGGPSLLHDYYSNVPLLSFAWGIGRISAPFTEHGAFHLFGLPLPVPANATFVASARALTAIDLRVQEFAPTESAASLSVSAVRGLLAFARGEQKISATITGTRDSDMTALLQSVEIEQKGTNAVVTVSVPFSMARRLAEPHR